MEYGPGPMKGSGQSVDGLLFHLSPSISSPPLPPFSPPRPPHPPSPLSPLFSFLFDPSHTQLDQGLAGASDPSSRAAPGTAVAWYAPDDQWMSYVTSEWGVDGSKVKACSWTKIVVMSLFNAVSEDRHSEDRHSTRVTTHDDNDDNV